MTTEELNRRCNLIESRLDELIPVEGEQKRVFDAIRYSLMAGGKRLRPILFLEFYRLCGGKKPDVALDFACALEMIHTYSLIHDDLPCMDNDDMRRGRPSCHKKFDYATALLAGDGLLNFAFEVMANTKNREPGQLDAIAYISKMSGIWGMIGGQTIDVCNNGCLSDIDKLTNMVKLKTGALIKAACVGGCLLASADTVFCNAAECYAENLGMAFQIQDDLLDVIGDENKLGKKTGSDEKTGKITFYTAFGSSGCTERVTRYSDKALSAMSVFSDHTFITDLTKWLVQRDM